MVGAALLVVGAGWFGCSDSPAGPAVRGGISGSVKEGSNGVAGATLTLSGGASRTATSAANGTFSFADLAAGAYSLALTPPNGFGLATGETGTRTLTVSDGQTATANFAVVTLTQTGTITGAVRNGQAGVSGASLALTGNGVNRSAATATGGTYSFADVAPGSYTITLTVPSGFELASGESAAKAATVTAGQSATVNFAVSPVSSGNLVIVNIVGFTFSPATTNIARGTTVRWVNGTTNLHTVTPDGHSEWADTNLPAGSQFQHTFNTAGTFAYFCTPHRSLGMTGTINVQ